VRRHFPRKWGLGVGSTAVVLSRCQFVGGCGCGCGVCVCVGRGNWGTGAAGGDGGGRGAGFLGAGRWAVPGVRAPVLSDADADGVAVFVLRFGFAFSNSRCC
jgi:hypothetical protein